MTQSDYTISIQPGYVRVEDAPGHEVVWSEQASKLSAIASAGTEGGTRNVLIAGSNTNVQLNPSETHALGEEIARLRLRVAIMDVHNASPPDRNLLEDTAENRGGRIQFFRREQDAIEWLLSEE